MEHFINEVTVMQYYIEQMDADKVNFLQGKEGKKKVIRGLIGELMAEDRMNYKIQIACRLWKELFDASMSFISTDKQGYDKLFKYFDAYVEFEELIFASDSFYRDHTLHCIWVYFLGEYIKRKEEFDKLFVDERAEDALLEVVNEFMKELNLLGSREAEEEFNYIIELKMKTRKYDEAVRCVSALTHDLGYPLKKIEKINKSIKKVLPYFAINNFDDFSFGYTNIQQEFVKDFIDFLSRHLQIGIQINGETGELLMSLFDLTEYGDVRSVNRDAVERLTEEKRQMLAGCVRLMDRFHKTVSSKVGFLNDFEDYKHGIMSAFLLFKNLSAFRNIDYDKTKEQLAGGMAYSSEETLAMQSILAGIAFHTKESFRIECISADNYLTFVDELEEFSRISRASQNREYVEEFCDTALYMEDGWLNIVFEFNNTELDNLDPEISFKGRCKRFLTLFNVKWLSPNLKIRVSCIGKLPTDQNTYVLEIAAKYAKIMINGEEQDIPKYLKSNQFYTSEEYAAL